MEFPGRSGAIVLGQSELRKLAEKINEYPEIYDETFTEVSARLQKSGFATKSDISILCFWKAIDLRTRWVTEFLNTPDAEIQGITKVAFSPDLEDEERLQTLAKLKGFKNWRGDAGGAIPSTVLTAWNPIDYGVVDVRVRNALRSLGVAGSLDYLTYLKLIRSIRNDLRLERRGTTARDVDKGLFMLAGYRKEGALARSQRRDARGCS